MAQNAVIRVSDMLICRAGVCHLHSRFSDEPVLRLDVLPD